MVYIYYNDNANGVTDMKNLILYRAVGYGTGETEEKELGMVAAYTRPQAHTVAAENGLLLGHPQFDIRYEEELTRATSHPVARQGIPCLMYRNSHI